MRRLSAAISTRWISLPSTGGLAEDHAAGATVGPTFQAIIASQFEALRAGDRFFWLNEGFVSATAATIAHTTLADIIKRNTDTTSQQANVFLVANPAPKIHVPPPARIDDHGRRFIAD